MFCFQKAAAGDETRGPRLASPRLASPTDVVVRTKAAPLFFLEEAMRIVYFASRVQGWGWGKKWRKREERRGGGKKDGGKKMEAKKSVLGAAKALCTRTRLIVAEERIFLERFRAVAKEIHR